MAKESGFNHGIAATLFAVCGAQALNWLITPQDHPHASTFRTTAVALQAVVGLAGAVVYYRRYKRTLGPAATPAEVTGV